MTDPNLTRTGETELFFPDHLNDDDHVAARRLRRQALLGNLPDAILDTVPAPASVQVDTYVVTALEGGEVKLDDDGRPVVKDGRAVLVSEPKLVERVVRADQVDEYEKVLASSEADVARDAALAAAEEEKD